MARDHARVNVTIWQDSDFRSLSPAAQHLYFVLWTHPDLSYCGVADWRPGRLSALSGGWSKDALNAAAAELSSNLFIVIDEDTEEALLRSWVKWDGLLKQPRLAVSMAKAYASTYSETLRGVLTHELAKLHSKHPDMAAFQDERITSLLEQPVVDPSDLPPFGQGFGYQFGDGFTQGFTPNSTSGLGTPYSCSYSNSTTPAPSSKDDGPARPKTSNRKTQMPEGWTPNESHREKAQEQNIDLDAEATKFQDHAIANGKTFVDWSRGFHTWLNNAQRFAPRTSGRPSGRVEPRNRAQERMDNNRAVIEQLRRIEEGYDDGPAQGELL